MLRLVSLTLMIVMGASLAYAQSAAIDQRKAIFKSFGAAAREPGAMLKGDAPFDLVKVQTLLKTLADGAPKLKELFPDDSKTGDTKALPAIWEKKADVLARFDKLAADAKAAEISIKDEATLKTELPKLFGSCGGCHREYRAQ